jgi:hypothetical protein
MSAWDIDPVGVRGVLETTIEAAKGIEGWGKGYSGHLQSAAESAGTLYMQSGERPEAGLVGAALGEFAEKTQTDIAYVVARATSSIQGASDATVAYVNGDIEMAEEAQAAALKEPKIDLPTGEG